jgi:hypothetical protein
MSDKSREEFEEWLSNYVQQEPKNLKLFMYKLLTVKEAWQEQQKKIDTLEADNTALKRNQENAVKMFKELLLMLDKVAEK